MLELSETHNSLLALSLPLPSPCVVRLCLSFYPFVTPKSNVGWTATQLRSLLSPYIQLSPRSFFSRNANRFPLVPFLSGTCLPAPSTYFPNHAFAQVCFISHNSHAHRSAAPPHSQSIRHLLMC